MTAYQDISKALVSRIAMLRHKKNREEDGLFVAEGIKCAGDLLPYFKIKWLVTGSEMCELPANMASIPHDRVLCASQTQMSKMSSLHTPPPLLAVYEMPQRLLSEQLTESSITLVADGVQDPGNLGTMVRLADWFGVRQMVCSRKCADIWSPKAVQSTMGALGRVNVVYYDIPELLKAHRSLPVYGLMLEGDSIYEAVLGQRGFIVMGNEGRGLTPEVRELLTHGLLIPSFPPGEPTSESLNVAMATAITLAEFRRPK